ncbi:MAG: rane protein required for colicin production [Campylobacterota bacterium]|nr:rane protein required for colicin production [Campylobacterota bacterium]
MDLSFLDVVIAILIILLSLKGFFKGLIKEIFGLLSIVGGVFFASKFAFAFGSYLDKSFLSIQNDGIKSLVGFIALFILVWGFIQLIGIAISKMTKLSGFGLLDNIGGALVGFAKMTLLFSIIAYSIGSVGFVENMFKTKLQNSLLYPILYKTGSYIVSLPESHTKEKVEEKAKEVLNDLEEANDGVMNNIESSKPLIKK